MQKPELVAPLVAIRLPARIENLSGFIGPVLAIATDYRLGEERKNDLELALEEALVNIFRYAYLEETGFVDLSCWLANGRLVIRIEDEGVPFSLTAAATPDISADIFERKIGGLGIHLMKNLMDDIRYRREGNRNVLELILSIDPQAVQQ